MFSKSPKTKKEAVRLHKKCIAKSELHFIYFIRELFKGYRNLTVGLYHCKLSLSNNAKNWGVESKIAKHYLDRLPKIDVS